MSNEAKLGTIPIGDEGRDAVHIAIVPVQAAVHLAKGSTVKLAPDGRAVPHLAQDAIGVVDPFRSDHDATVKPGEWFWLCLYPKTVTGLRHVWEHPLFQQYQPAASVAPSKEVEESKTWLLAYVRQHCPYWHDEPDQGLRLFLRYVEQERWIYYYGSDCHDLSDVEDAGTLFHHLSVVLGREINESFFEAFTCSC